MHTTDLSGQVRAQLGVDRSDGALVVDVTAGSAAENAGIRVGDVITGLAGEDIDDSAGLGDVASDLEPGQQSEIEIDRDGDVQTLTITIGSRPASVA